MTIGERIKIARRAAGMNQRSLGEAAGVSAMAISKYERGLDVPGSAVLLRLAEALGVKTEYFFRPSTVALTSPSYRRRLSLARQEQHVLLGQVQDWLERYLEVENLFGGPPGLSLPSLPKRRISSLEEVEGVVLALRGTWSLGLNAIESLVEVLEDRGIKVGIVDAGHDFDALTLWANEEIPVIVVKSGVPGDRQRFNLAHELGHLILEIGQGVDAEKAAHRFAGAFLVPEPAARFELGEERRSLDLYELHLLKHKYGLSMQAWVHRAQDLGIISTSGATRLYRLFRRRGWHRREPGEEFPPEEPGRMKRLVVRALAEDLISQSRAAELLGMPLSEFWQEAAKEHDWVRTAVCG